MRFIDGCVGMLEIVPKDLAHYLRQRLYDTAYMPNTLADFPSDRFAIHAHCACGHWAQVHTTALPADLRINALRGRLHCQVCGSREVSIRILWTAAGGFKHSGGVAA